MNRYSLMFAVLVAASFTVHSNRAGETGKAAGEKDKPAAAIRVGPELVDPVNFIQAFLKQAETPNPIEPNEPRILFALVPHPTATHLAEAFDHNVDALQDGLQASGYLFDSAWIPWKLHESRDQFDDDAKEKQARSQENGFPGVLLFRRNRPAHDPYREGLVVFLIGERPVGGIFRSQVQQAIQIIHSSGIGLSNEIRILGPTYSGSFPSLVPAVMDLLDANKQANAVFLRSGSFTACGAAYRAVQELHSLRRNVNFDLGSTNHDSSERIAFIGSALAKLGINSDETAILTEGETLYGEAYRGAIGVNRRVEENRSRPEVQKTKEVQIDDQVVNLCQNQVKIGGMWSIPFPRDISNLRAGYENQGLFDGNSTAQPWKRYLSLKNDSEGEGDSVHKYGGSGTMEAQESVLFGISEFLKTHEILAAVILATNEQDRYFLTQFLHANNSNVRVVVLDPTRLFLRGSTAQFRGDLFLGEFPMLPWMHDWTAHKEDLASHIFADDISQGTFFAAVDLFADQTKPPRWYSEYSEPDWKNRNPVLRPPMYLVAMGGNGTWPVAEATTAPMSVPASENWQMSMPFELFAHGAAQGTVGEAPAAPERKWTRIQMRSFWKVLFWVIAGTIAAYCIFFWCANPVARSAFVSFDPSNRARFWIFKVAIPGAVAGCAFRVLAWSVAIPMTASYEAAYWWRWAEAFTIAAPLAIAVSAMAKALGPNRLPLNWRMTIPFVPVGAAIVALALPRVFWGDRFMVDVSSILNTFREMHWESGLSLVPTAMLFLAAYLVWSCQASNGAAVLDAAPPLPDCPKSCRISQDQARKIAILGRPFPFTWKAKWLWVAWLAAAAAILMGQFHFRPFTEITSLEAKSVTRLVFRVSSLLTALIVLELLQFVWLWIELRTLLRALNREDFRRSFVPIHDFNWRSLWTVAGVSFDGRRSINTAHIDSLLRLARVHGLTMFEASASKLEKMRTYYDVMDLEQISRRKLATSRHLFFRVLNLTGKRLMEFLEEPASVTAMIAAEGQHGAETATPSVPAVQESPHPIVVCQCSTDSRPYKDEEDELSKLPKWQQEAEKFICLMYIGFIQAVVARLHTQLISISACFSLMVLGFAIYPFQPLAPLLLAGLVLLLLIALAFYRVFREMDHDPILSRIVDGDDRKLQGNFYTKLAESLALPLLTLASSLLPGGAGRLLELAQTLFNHGQ